MKPTLFHRVFEPLKRLLPVSLVRPIRAVFTAILTPLYFSGRSGHFRSSLSSIALDSNGEPIPWYTYPAIEFLRSRDFSGRTVLEFGAGQSTMWWSQRALAVISFEEDKAWYQRVLQLKPSNVELIHCSDKRLSDIEDRIMLKRFDIIVIDGFDRFIAVKKSYELLKSDGALIVDNSDGYWGEEGTYPIINFLMSQGLKRVDFCGHSPANILVSSTSVFFRDDCWLFSQTTPPLN